MTSRGYKTLPSAFRRNGQSTNGQRPASRSGRGAASPLTTSEGIFSGFELKIGHLISGGMNFIGNFRRNKTPNNLASTSMSSSPSSPASTSGAYWECQSQLQEASSSVGGQQTSANVSELIEMTSFKTVAEGDLELQTGKGHDFVVVASFNPTWCDLCRDLIWGLYDTGAMRCANCNLTCHNKCKANVQLNCTAFERPKSTNSSSSSSSGSSCGDLSTLANISTIADEEVDEVFNNDEDDNEGTLKNVDMSAFKIDENSTCDDVTSLETDDEKTLVDSAIEDSMIAQDEFQSAIMLYNDGFPPGQETITENGQCKGFIRVIMNLSRPINVLPGTRPPSVLNLTQDSLHQNSEKHRTLTSFYLPPETEKALCVTSATTTHDVIRSLLAKFRIVDNPHKYMLYEKRPFAVETRRKSSAGSDNSTVTISGSVRSRATLGRINLRKLENSDRPLMIALNNCLKDDFKCVFVLQENDPGEIDWESFSMPELKNFLLILDREEAWYKRKIHEKYELIHVEMKRLAEEKKEEQS